MSENKFSVLLVAFVVAAQFALPGKVSACDGNGCGTDVDAFGRLYGHSCYSGRDTLNKQEAVDAATKIYRGEIDLEQFVAIYDRICSSVSATQVAQLVRSGQADYPSFMAMHLHSCNSGRDTLNMTEALSASKEIARGSIDLYTFTEVYNRVCSSGTAIGIAGEVRRSQLSLNVFVAYLGHSCNSGRDTLDMTESKTLAENAMNRRFSVAAFGEAYNLICSSPSATSIAFKAGEGVLNIGVFKQTFGHSCNSGRDTLDLSEATQIAEYAGRHEIKLGIFYNTYNQTCDFALAKQLACAGQLGYRLGDLDSKADRLAAGLQADDDSSKWTIPNVAPSAPQGTAGKIGKLSTN